MEELSREYALLFNGITDAIQAMEKTTRRLKYLQQRAEELYLSDGGEGMVEGTEQNCCTKANTGAEDKKDGPGQ